MEADRVGVPIEEPTLPLEQVGHPVEVDGAAGHRQEGTDRVADDFEAVDRLDPRTESGGGRAQLLDQRAIPISTEILDDGPGGDDRRGSTCTGDGGGGVEPSAPLVVEEGLEARPAVVSVEDR